MSEIVVEFELTCKDKKTCDYLEMMLSSYDYASSSEDGFDKELKLLSMLALDGESLFNDDTANCTVDYVNKKDAKTLQFQVVGGTISGGDFISGLVELLRELPESELYSISFNTQVGEYTLMACVDGELHFYETSMGGEYDEEIMEALEAEDADQLAVVKRLLSEGKLVMPEQEEELFHGYPVEIFEDEEKYDELLGKYVVHGMGIWVLIALVGWLGFDYLWWSVGGGFLAGVVYVFRHSFAMDSAKEAYDEDLANMLKEDAEELGLTEEQAIALLNKAGAVMEKAMKRE